MSQKNKSLTKVFVTLVQLSHICTVTHFLGPREQETKRGKQFLSQCMKNLLHNMACFDLDKGGPRKMYEFHKLQTFISC